MLVVVGRGRRVGFVVGCGGRELLRARRGRRMLLRRIRWVFLGSLLCGGLGGVFGLW